MIKKFNKGKKIYEPYVAIVPEVKSKYDLYLPKGQLSNIFTPSDSYNFISPYIQKTNLLNVCYLDEDLENVHKKDPISYALSYLPSFSNFPIISRKIRYYYEFILEETGSCAFSHKFHGDDWSHHQIPH